MIPVPQFFKFIVVRLAWTLGSPMGMRRPVRCGQVVVQISRNSNCNDPTLLLWSYNGPGVRSVMDCVFLFRVIFNRQSCCVENDSSPAIFRIHCRSVGLGFGKPNGYGATCAIVARLLAKYHGNRKRLMVYTDMAEISTLWVWSSTTNFFQQVIMLRAFASVRAGGFVGTNLDRPPAPFCR